METLSAVMNSFYFILPLLAILVIFAQSSYASILEEGFNRFFKRAYSDSFESFLEEPAFGVKPEHIHYPTHVHAPVTAAFPVAPVATVVPSLSAVPVSPALGYHHMFPYGHYYHPFAAVHNLAKSYAKVDIPLEHRYFLEADICPMA
ncbi:unnamed protein product [Strongylus vulgaris]|uniref:Uncharacterized protein n=1 Tax=Strongylus vulgaris TaxID=40348 RepID=A0A3P7LWZ7_STRVU|nr:unnamed protein product [Strongylus vulgaris]